MPDFCEIDFIGVETSKSGDAIAVRYSCEGLLGIHVIDGGYIDTGSQIVEKINTYYNSNHIDNVILTHPDRDHANGLRFVLENCSVGALWMNRPWLYAEELISRFPSYSSVSALKSKLKSAYPASAQLEEIAQERNIIIKAPFQGEKIGPFYVLSPTKARYLDLIVASDKTPQASNESLLSDSFEALSKALRSMASFVKAAWGEEYFPASGTSSENEMSVVQYAFIDNKKIILTGDTGRDGLNEAADYSPNVGLSLPGVNLFQVPHHGGRHNVSTEVLDRWLGPRGPDSTLLPTWSAVCSSAKADEDHPRKSVIRAIIHRRGHFAATEGMDICWSTGISRVGWTSIPQADYPTSQEN